MLKQAPLQHLKGLHQSWLSMVIMLWDSPNPQAVLNILGTDAAELFNISLATTKFLESISPGICAAGIAKIRPFTINLNGTVTINPAP